MFLVAGATGHVGGDVGGGGNIHWRSANKTGPADRCRPHECVFGRDQIRSGKRTMNLPAFGIFTLGRLLASSTSLSPMILLSDRI